MKCLLVVVILLVYSCSTQDGGEKGQGSENVNPTVGLIDEAGFGNLVSNRKGKILLINVWATWCAPCREEFPDLVKIANEYHTRNVEVVGISADFPDEIDAKVKPFLKSQHATFQNYIKNFEDDEAFINSVNPKWSGALPATFVYDVDGKLRDSYFGQNDVTGFRMMIEQIAN
jgi:thiol-disulfide isomerase/thioredoxin